MSSIGALFETVPNISEGRDGSIIDECIGAMESAGARVVHRTSDVAHNRSVLTAVGPREAVSEAAIALAGVTTRRIDLRVHRGVHPRIGALDVLPFVPLKSASLADAASLAREAAAEIWRRFRVPSYLYGDAATQDERRHLANVRRGEFEGLSSRSDTPDVGEGMHPGAGAIAVGARPLLVAFNVDLASGDLAVAKEIAAVLRERGGGLGTLRAIGVMRAPGVAQVSFNITDFVATPVYRIVELVRALAAERGTGVARSELIGLIPRRALTQSAAYYAHDGDALS